MDWEAQDDGFVAKLIVAEGTKDVAVGQPVIVIVEEQVRFILADLSLNKFQKWQGRKRYRKLAGSRMK